MDLPKKYPYAMSPGCLLLGILFFGGGTLFFIHLGNNSSDGLSVVSVQGPDVVKWFYGTDAFVAAIFAMALLVVAAKQLFGGKRQLVLDHEALLLPRGPLKTGHYTIPYSQLANVWERNVDNHKYLCLQVGAKRFTIDPHMMADKAGYAEVCEFLSAKVRAVKGG